MALELVAQAARQACAGCLSVELQALRTSLTNELLLQFVELGRVERDIGVGPLQVSIGGRVDALGTVELGLFGAFFVLSPTLAANSR